MLITWWAADMILHTVATLSTLADCLAVAGADDSILLMGDGVYAALANSEFSQTLKASGLRIEVMESDASAAGIAQELLAFPATDMAGFVALTEEYPRQLAWY
ncbi:hypothetical protein A3709_13270 [Halioglobus sp. HI00S01]|uniref:sulfurtransferase complex subunit TusB n=1 Tax=Halioglobus sp. HI00S01 TaxID=1822214 RepID=UPI0007C377DF|nr:sulfurtransferase complex subunit TusB [Halioglobus sp. HI00S01]KZX60254.1 hypothetical protein A3709_13270 [Halioglobus sp. HI00S01]